MVIRGSCNEEKIYQLSFICEVSKCLVINFYRNCLGVGYNI